MAFTPTNFLESDRALDQIAQEATTLNALTSQGVQRLVQAADGLVAMQTGWASAAQFIDDQAAANPTDTEWQGLKARKDKMVADFLAMRDRAIAVRDAAQSV